MKQPKKVLFSILLISASFGTFSQLATYDFNSNINDQLNNYDPVEIFGSPDFSSGEYMALDSGEYLVLPTELNQAFDTTQSLEINVRFKVEGDWRVTTALDGRGEEARIILSSKPEYDQRFEGFDITAREWENSLWIIATYGDGLIYENGLQSEGKLDFITQIDTGIWYDLTVKFFFQDNPYIQYIVNGTASFSFYDDRINYGGFQQTVATRQIAVGSNIGNSIAYRDGQHPNLDLQLDYLSFSSPVASGDVTKVASSLSVLIDHMNGVAILTQTQLDSVQGVFVDNWDKNSYDANTEIVQEYMTTYSEKLGFVFTLKFNGERPEDFDQLKFIQFQIQQWIIDNKYTMNSMSEMEGLIFKEHENFPGIVSANALRVQDGQFTIDADYQTDPGFYLNDQEYVRRPTGFFLPAGELVTVTVPDEAVGQGLVLYAGAHRKNLQETWNEFRRFPRVSTQVPLDSETVTITNPFGGGIYVTVPDSTQLGSLTFGISGAVKAPYYSTKEGYSTSLSVFLAEIQKQEVPWVDMESDNFMTTIPNGQARLMTDPDSVLYFWDKSFDAINLALGRPQKRFRGEYILVDRQSHVKYTAAPAAYPMSLEVYDYPYELREGAPTDVAVGKEWYNAKTAGNYILWHEYGHLHNMPTLYFEQETNVHLLATVAYNQVMGESIDSAFVYAVWQRLNLEQATFDWLLTDNFINGERIGYEPDNPWDQLLYQSRGLVKLVDIGKMFGWGALGEINQYFYGYQIDNPSWTPYDLKDDQLILAASEQLGFNMAPHFEFHGIIPSDELVDQLRSMPTSDTIKQRLLHYRSLVPANNQEFQPLYDAVIAKINNEFHGPRWDALLSNYDEEYAGQVVARIDTIISKYYELTDLDLNDEPRIIGLSQPLSTAEDTSLELTLSDLLVDDSDHNYPEEHVLMVFEGSNYTVSDHTIIPAKDFNGTLFIPLKVNDGLEDSQEFIAEMTIEPVNDPPVIQGTTGDFATTDNKPLTLSLSDLVVTDIDNAWPTDFTLIVLQGEHYTVSGTEVSPTKDYDGTLLVPTQVSDGEDVSNEFILEVSVTDVLGLPDSDFAPYPNPTDGHISFESVPPNTTYEIINLDGRILQSGRLNASGIQFEAVEGTYVLNVITAEAKYSVRFVKK